MSGTIIGRVVVSSSAGGPPRSTPTRVTPRLHIDMAGRVVDVDLGSGSGYDEVDRSIQASMRAQRFSPALLDGKPAEVWLSANKAELVR
ncbi:MAG: energy transducer TonB [Gemmatimonadaceae bacterium]|nr:energy transducer TonB [Gemmatimonadaceae bacterium]